MTRTYNFDIACTEPSGASAFATSDGWKFNIQASNSDLEFDNFIAEVKDGLLGIVEQYCEHLHPHSLESMRSYALINEIWDVIDKHWFDQDQEVTVQSQLRDGMKVTFTTSWKDSE